MKGPVGNGGGGQKNQSYFDDEEWCNTNGFVFSGYVVYHSDYVNALQPLSISTKESGAGNEMDYHHNPLCSAHVVFCLKLELHAKHSSVAKANLELLDLI